MDDSGDDWRELARAFERSPQRQPLPEKALTPRQKEIFEMELEESRLQGLRQAANRRLPLVEKLARLEEQRTRLLRRLAREGFH